MDWSGEKGNRLRKNRVVEDQKRRKENENTSRANSILLDQITEKDLKEPKCYSEGF